MRGKGSASRRAGALAALAKVPSGISGLDEVTGGGLPRGRPTLVCGGPGCGKTLLALEFLLRGVIDHGEPGVCVSFEERIEDLEANVASLGFDLPALVRRKRLVIDYVHVERNDIEENGEYDLEGLFVRVGHAIDQVGAKRVVLDTVEALFSSFNDQSVLRAELRRLFQWLKDRGVTTVITGERGDKTLTRQGLEEYVSDCVILLDHRVINQVSTRRLRVVKYRGSTHGTNEYPFLIDADGISVLPVTSIGLQHEVSNRRLSTGIAGLDAMLGGKGYYEGASILLSGTAGTGKTTTAAAFVDAACRRGERALFFAFEESRAQIVRNMGSVGLKLEPWIDRGLLRIVANRPSLFGLEMHLAAMHKAVTSFRPRLVVIDQITNLSAAGQPDDVLAMLLRMIDFLKGQGVTCVCTSLTRGGDDVEATELDISSLMDTWILLRDIELAGERNRGVYVLKSRGMAHSNQIREFLLTSRGIELRDVYLGESGILTGSARLVEEARAAAQDTARRDELAQREAGRRRQRVALEAQIAALEDELRAQVQADEQGREALAAREGAVRDEIGRMAASRRAVAPNPPSSRRMPRRPRS